ncbi:hypothetical protein VUR80DRAFT_6383 [Thermomyces stellatus]
MAGRDQRARAGGSVVASGSFPGPGLSLRPGGQCYFRLPALSGCGGSAVTLGYIRERGGSPVANAEETAGEVAGAGPTQSPISRRKKKGRPSLRRAAMHPRGCPAPLPSLPLEEAPAHGRSHRGLTSAYVTLPMFPFDLASFAPPSPDPRWRLDIQEVFVSIISRCSRGSLGSFSSRITAATAVAHLASFGGRFTCGRLYTTKDLHQPSRWPPLPCIRVSV